jgi:formate dehydrogenase iron-sulfur subunit
VEVIERIIRNQQRDKNLEVLNDLCELMLDGSLCALGGLTPYPVESAVRHFPEDFSKPAATPPRTYAAHPTEDRETPSVHA